MFCSPLYSPAVGPAIRAAISKYDVDVILDGEILAWDAHENKAVPFGTNRAVAEMRRNQRAADGTLDERDCNLHKDARDANVMSLAKEKSFKHLDSAGINQMKETTSSDQYWLKYVVFDIIYVGERLALCLSLDAAKYLTNCTLLLLFRWTRRKEVDFQIE